MDAQVVKEGDWAEWKGAFYLQVQRESVSGKPIREPATPQRTQKCGRFGSSFSGKQIPLGQKGSFEVCFALWEPMLSLGSAEAG